MNYDNKHQQVIIRALWLWCFLLLTIHQVQGQTNAQDKTKDSLKVLKLNTEFETAIKQKKYTQAISLGKTALQISEKQLFVKGKIKCLTLFGQLYTTTNKTSEALTYFLRAESFAQSFNAEIQLINIYDNLGQFYQQLNLFKKGLQYLKQAYDLRKKNNYLTGLDQNLENIAFCYSVLEQYTSTQVFYEKLVGLYRKQKKQEAVINTIEKLALITSVSKQYNKAIKHYLTLLNYYKKKKDISKISNIYNDLGFLYQRKDDAQTAINYFGLSSEIIRQKSNPIPDDQRITLLINTGVAYTNLESFNRAKKNFQQAAQLAQNDQLKQAEIHNYAGSNYYLSGNNFQALNEVEQAIAIARPKKAWNILLTSYKLLSLIHKEERNNKKAQEFNIRYLALKRQLKDEEAKRKKEASYNLALMDQQEKRIKNVLGQERQYAELRDKQEQQKRDLALKDNLVQLQKNQLALITKERELDAANYQRAQLDKVRQEQALQISEGKLREAKLAAEKSNAALALEREKAAKKLREERNRRQVAELERQKQSQKKELELQKARQKYAIGIIILIAAILGLVSWVLIVTRKNKRKLQKQKTKIEDQNGEIISQNEELYQQQEEIMAQRDAIEQKNTLLSNQNLHIQQSIQAALTIQDAISPNPEKTGNLLGTHFIIYRPKDIVSGDFYWLEKVENRTFVAAVDCTGHGVPGAFMSMIGNNLLNQILQLQKIHEPDRILTALNKEVETVLRQKEKGYRNGMDMILASWEQGKAPLEVVFCGAKRPLYHYKKATDEMQRIKGNRYSIGYQNPDFEQEVITVERGDSIYLCSDGFVDQNNEARKKFGYKRFEALLHDCQQHPMEKQQEIIEQALDKHMGSAEQRDDILLIGVRF
ncbi:SpoIIE family protein phosphatase [uncultured Microscilla sp.]|uniref:SpoIIE family protein phosphatase n=1 Tax=uncultured Microscilla sp. TaxID=432653 RepID=UPI00262BC93C|nr:SpoIIE family protein phosphatase [uncultured Microscilla sp.]